jgi:hypothetical protein
VSWFRKLLGLCDHQWTTFAVMEIRRSDRPELVIAHLHQMRCTKCGEIKAVRT